MAGVALALLCACAARTERMVPEVTAAPAADRSSPLYQAIALADVGAGKETSSLVGAADFRDALRQALDTAGFLAPDKERAPYRLKAFIIEVKPPSFGLTFSADSFVRYTLVRAKDASVVFDDVLQGTCTATLGEELFGPERGRIAREGAMRDNIRALLARLRTTRPST
jgi:hypothetical protein